MSKGRVTIPTDASYVEETKRIAALWGADAVRDCDGTELPDNPKEIADKVYKTYFLTRGDNDFAYAHDELRQSMALTSEAFLATEQELKIDPLKGYFRDQVGINEEEPKKYWQVFDRTSGEEIFDWDYDSKEKVVIVHHAEYMHEYTVSFFGDALWNATQIYNYLSNNWDVTKDRDIDPIFPEALAKIKENLEEWIIANPHINVLRFTTFFYHFFLVNNTQGKSKYFEWFGYAMAASPAMFRAFEKEKGYALKIEDIVDAGYYGSQFRSPSQKRLDFMDFVQKFVAKTMKEINDICHKHGRESMMFLGDGWIGAELYGKYFADMELDAIVGTLGSGVTERMLAETPGVRYREARLAPYFFNNEMGDDEEAINALNTNWLGGRRGLMRKPVDRIGFGGYLKDAAERPRFMAGIEKLCNEFRDIHEVVAGKKPYCALKIAVLNEWGHLRSWMTHMVTQDYPYPKMHRYQGILETLSGMPVDVHFINFDDVRAGKLSDYDVVLNYGDRDTALVGVDVWSDPEITSAVRKYIYEGGGFIGMGEPTSALHGGKFFQLADALGVDEEVSLSMLTHKYHYEKTEDHFITADVTGDIDYCGDLDNIYALEGTTILDVDADKYLGLTVDRAHVRMACKEFGKGRTFYMTGMKFNNVNIRLLYRALLWTAGKEDELEKAYSSNVNTECHYYPASNKYAVVNNTQEEQKTNFFDIDGNKKELVLEPLEIVWL